MVSAQDARHETSPPMFEVRMCADGGREGWVGSCRLHRRQLGKKRCPGSKIIFVGGNVWVPLLRMARFSPNSWNVSASALGT